MKNLNDDIHSISTPRFRCIISYKTFICDHQGKKFVIDHTEASIHKSRVAAQNNQTQTTFLPVANDAILQKVIFAELKIDESEFRLWRAHDLKVNLSIHYIDEDNVRTGNNETDFGGFISVTKSL